MKSRRLDDIKLSDDSTREQVLALWGPPDATRGSGTGIDFMAYTLENGQELWFVWNLEPPCFGEGAVLISTTGEYKRLFWKPRRLDDIKLSGKLTHDQVLGLWGPPDAFPGSGMPYEAYALEGGQAVWLLYEFDPPYRLGSATLFLANGEHKSVLPKAKE